MTIEEIINNWTEDSKIKREDLEGELINIPQLHSKYLNILTFERLKLSNQLLEMKILKRDCFVFYKDGASEEDWKEGKKEINRKILKSDIPIFLDADPDIVKLSKKIEIQKEKVDYLLEIMKQIHNKSYTIKYIIDLRRYGIGE